MSTRKQRDITALINNLTADGGDDDNERQGTFHEAFADHVELPADGHVIGEPVEVVAVDYRGNARRGITATCRRSIGSYTVGMADVEFAEGTPASLLANAYRRWLGIEAETEARGAAQPAPKKHKADVGDISLDRPVELIVLSVKERVARCRLPGTQREISLRATKLWHLVPGEIATIQPRKQWSYNGHPYLSGEIKESRLDVKALGLVPLELTKYDDDDPRDGAWRPQFEMEQVELPARGDWGDCPLVEAMELREGGDNGEADRLLMAVLAEDLRCLDAHAQLGDAALAAGLAILDPIRHYEVGLRVGELSLEGFDAVLPWTLLGNRPFLRCLHGYGLCLWRAGRHGEAAVALERLLSLNPADEQQARDALAAVRSGAAWDEQG